MEASIMHLSHLLPPPPSPPPRPNFEPDTEKIKQRLLKNGVYPTPKILRNLRKKEIQKYNRKAKREADSKTKSSPTPLTEQQTQALEEESRFQTLRREYKRFNRAIAAKRGGESKTGDDGGGGLMVGKPWEGIERVRLKELASGRREEVVDGGKLRRENLVELREVLEKDLRWVLEDDVDVEGFVWSENEKKEVQDATKRRRNEGEAIKVLVDRLSGREITEKHWKFVRIMKQSGLQFTEHQLLKIIEGLGKRGSWKQALAVVHWVYADKQRRDLKSRFVYTKLLSVLGIARRPEEALRVFNLMLEDRQVYPDMAAYHSIAVTLGQAGLLRELVKIIECMRQKPKRVKNLCQKNWDPVLEPDLVIYNAVMNACVPSRQWKGVSWVFDQLRQRGLRPNGATYGLAMEVMLESGKYELVHELFQKMKRSGEAPKAITYKVLVKTLWKEGKINEAVEVIRDMEQRGVIGTAALYYELACCLCNNGRWRDAVPEVEKMKKLPHSKPLEVTFTGLITASMDGGHINDCIAIFHHMKDRCSPNIGTINTMLKVYGKNDMFFEAKELFEEIKRGKSAPQAAEDDCSDSLVPDEYTYSSMLEASARALQWEYFEYVYQEMILSGYQLDQAKHASLLVEASRAGKWYLLDHAFDSLLEAGEIPHPTFFTEMLCHATAQGNYERAIALINTVALAPFQISEKQWTDLLEKNQDWIKQENLEKLFDALHNCDSPAEPTVFNLWRSLKSLCGINDKAVDASPILVNGRRFHDTDGVSATSYESMMSSNKKTDDDSLVKEADVPYAAMSSTDDVEIELDARLLYVDHNENRISELLSNTKCSASNDKSGDPADFIDNELSTLGFKGLTIPVDDDDDDGDDGESMELDLPSARDILEEWEESRKKDGLVFPFQLRRP